MITLCKFDNLFLESSWEWLNDPDIVEAICGVRITRNQQNKWFKTLELRNDYKIWGVKFEDNPIGACGLKNITNYDCEYWGYIGVKSLWGKGLGSLIIDHVFVKAKILNLQSVWLKVKHTNARAIKLYLKKGFNEESVNETFTIMRVKL